MNDQLADFRGTGERYLVYIRVSGEGSPCSLTIAGNDIYDSLRKSGFHDQLTQPQSGERRLLCGLQHDGAAGRQGGSQFPRSHQQREVPRDDLSDDSNRLAQCVSQVLRARRVGNGDRNRIALDLGGPARHVAKQVRGQGHVGCFRDAERLSIVETLDVAELFSVSLQQIGELPDQTTTFRGGHLSPRSMVEGLARGVYCLLDVVTIALCHLRQYLAGRGIVGWESLAGSGVHPLAIDQHLAGFFDEVRDLRMDLRGNCDAHTSSFGKSEVNRRPARDKPRMPNGQK